MTALLEPLRWIVAGAEVQAEQLIGADYLTGAWALGLWAARRWLPPGNQKRLVKLISG